MTPAQLRKWRGARTQREVAASLGMSPQHYTKLETGKVKISRVIELACQAIGKTTQEN